LFGAAQGGLRAMSGAKHSRVVCLVAELALLTSVVLGSIGSAAAAETTLHYFPSGTIYDYRWKLLQLALAHTASTSGPVKIAPYAEDVTQNRGVRLLQSGVIDVIALGTNPDREQNMRAIKIDILRGVVGFRLLVIRANEQASIARMDDQAVRKHLVFGLNSQWADLPIMRANGFSVVTSSNYENLFAMLAAGRFDAFPRGLNEAQLELDERGQKFPQLVIERSKALYFPYPIYFWVNKKNRALARRIERGLQMALTDGSFQRLFEKYHAHDIAAAQIEQRHIIMLENPLLPAETDRPDTGWWWPRSVALH
jgi:hypothetical protein